MTRTCVNELGCGFLSRATERSKGRFRLLVGLLATLVLLGSQAAWAREESSILFDYDTGQVLEARNPDAMMFPASLTKMMTLYITFSALQAGRLDMDSKLRVSPRAAGMPPTKLGVPAGGTIRVDQAILALITKSANDVAATLGESLGGSESRFADIMTRTARALGMRRTTFRNASGLPDPAQQTTARDMGILATRLIQDFPQYYRLFSTRVFVHNGRSHGNHNRLLAIYRGMDGLKTGYTRSAGYNLAASAVRDGRRLVAVVLGAQSPRVRDAHMTSILDDGFDEVNRRGVLVADADRRPARPAASVVAARTVNASVAVTESVDESDDEAVEQAASVAIPKKSTAKASAVAKAQPTTKGKKADRRVVASAPTPQKRVAGKTTKSTKVASTRNGKKSVQVAAAQPARKGSSRKNPAEATPYGIQVGAFSAAKPARSAALAALKKAPSELRGTFVNVSSKKVNGKTLYRATLVGLAKDDADSACRKLKRSRQECMVLRTVPVSLAAN